MAKNLLIVESPAKAKTIEKYLGSDFVVKSSYGHIRDLKDGDSAIDVKNNYEPIYEVSDEKKKVVTELKKATKGADEVWLATDEDREGEAISWHLCEVLGLDPKTTKRIVFNEITKPAIIKAIQNPRKLNLDLVDAQQARRVLDRLVGFELSPILWRKISGGVGLSAGRVQSVAVRLIVEREREIKAFNVTSFHKVVAYFVVKDAKGKTTELKAEADKKFEKYTDAIDFLEACQQSTFQVGDIQIKPSKRTPAAPFTTSTLQQEASRKLGFSVAKTMLVAQNLYEAGYITYMRTDSVNLSETAVSASAKAIQKMYGKDYIQHRKFKNKNESAQEAHEAIRPTDLEKPNIEAERDQTRLYELIWKRTIASQMADAELEKTNISITISKDKNRQFIAVGEVIKFDGFLKVYLESNDDEENDEENENEKLLPPVKVGELLQYKKIVSTERYTRPPARYTEASLVKKLEELGIGRPSTYAPTISTIQKRNYVVKDAKEGEERKFRILTLANDSEEIIPSSGKEITGADKGKLSPSDTGFLVNDFLIDNFSKVMDFSFTARIENQFDEIANGDLKWKKMIDSFYKPFHSDVEKTMEQANRVTGEREIGTDPKTGKRVIVRMARFGPVFQIGGEDGEKPVFIKLPANKTMDQVTIDDMYTTGSFPRTLGNFENTEVSVNTGRFGPYIKLNSLFVSIPKAYDPLEITLEQAIVLIEEKRVKEANRIIQGWDEENISIQNGRWGPFIKHGKENYKLPKGTDANKISLKEVKALIAEQSKSTSSSTKKKSITKKK